ncbi:MAG: four helix bundle protein [Bacteroidota bacterium]
MEERTYQFARECRLLVRELPKTVSNIEDGKQLVKSSGSIGANYIEANEKLGEKNLKFRLRISRKEAKASKYWLRTRLELFCLSEKFRFCVQMKAFSNCIAALRGEKKTKFGCKRKFYSK